MLMTCVALLRSHTLMVMTPNFQGGLEGPGGGAVREEGGEEPAVRACLASLLSGDHQGSGAMIPCLGEGGQVGTWHSG